MRLRLFWRWIQKGVLQISKGLYAKLVHANLTPWTVLINAAVSLSSACIVAYGLILTLGDWEIAGLTHTILLMTPDGSLTSWEFPKHYPPTSRTASTR